jgi:hypothetical protein
VNNLHKVVTPPKGSAGIRKQLSDADLRKAAHRAELSHQLHGNGDPIARSEPI